MKLLTTLLRSVMLGLLLLAGQAQAQAQTATPAQTPEREGLVLIAHPGVPRLDIGTAQRLYTGRLVELAGVAVSPVNIAAQNILRDRFMAQVMNQEDDKYVAYWTVRKYIGKGTPPRELKNAAEVIEYVQNTPGGLGYVSAGDVKPGMNVVLRP
jgi:hypothetical protein